MLMSYKELINEVVRCGYLQGVDVQNVNASSIDVRLGEMFLAEEDYLGEQIPVVDLANKEDCKYYEEKGVYYLEPGERILCHTQEVFNLPDHISAEFRLKSSGARSGLNHALAVWVDAGFHDSVLTLEITNTNRYHALKLTAGMKIGQVIFYRHAPVPREQSYAVRGQYNGDKSVSANKGIR